MQCLRYLEICGQCMHFRKTIISVSPSSLINTLDYNTLFFRPKYNGINTSILLPSAPYTSETFFLTEMPQFSRNSHSTEVWKRIIHSKNNTGGPSVMWDVSLLSGPVSFTVSNCLNVFRKQSEIFSMGLYDIRSILISDLRYRQTAPFPVKKCWDVAAVQRTITDHNRYYNYYTFLTAKYNCASLFAGSAFIR